MVPSSVTSAIMILLVFGGLVFHDDIVDRIARLDSDSELRDTEDFD